MLLLRMRLQDICLIRKDFLPVQPAFHKEGPHMPTSQPTFHTAGITQSIQQIKEQVYKHSITDFTQLKEVKICHITYSTELT